MRITLEVEDAIRMVDCLNCTAARLCAKEISQRTGVSLRFALKILRKLCAAQVIRSYKGVGGGYKLNKRPEEISLLDIVEAVDGRISLTRCVETDICSKNRNKTNKCKFYHLYSNLTDSICEKFAGITFNQISDINTHTGGNKMQIAVLSGKGGTGKTFVSVNLAFTASNSAYMDCDVEEPNGHLFLKPENNETKYVEAAVPEFDDSKCDGCRACVKFCRFNALAFIKNKPRLFPELCHSCSGCMLICHNHAIHERNRQVGKIEFGKSGTISVITGTMNSGEATGVPVIRQLLKNAPATGTTILDCPPGSSCTVMESIKDSDFCLLVAEPTLFGIENLKLVVQLVKIFQKKCGIIVNKDTGSIDRIKILADENNIPILGRIPYDKTLAEINARGGLAAENRKYRQIFHDLLAKIDEAEGGEL